MSSRGAPGCARWSHCRALRLCSSDKLISSEWCRRDAANVPSSLPSAKTRPAIGLHRQIRFTARPAPKDGVVGFRPKSAFRKRGGSRLGLTNIVGRGARARWRRENCGCLCSGVPSNTTFVHCSALVRRGPSCVSSGGGGVRACPPPPPVATAKGSATRSMCHRACQSSPHRPRICACKRRGRASQF